MSSILETEYKKAERPYSQNELKYFIDSVLSKKNISKFDTLDPDFVEKIKSNFKKYPSKNLNKIWSLISFQMWQERWM